MSGRELKLGGSKRWAVGLAFSALLSTVSAGCVRSSGARAAEVVSHSTDGVVAVATMHDSDPGNVTLCSGAVVAPNLVLTARHCVSKALTTTPSCDADGNSHNGAHVGTDADPGHIAIYIRSSVDIERDAPDARAVRTVRPSGRVLCDADVAYLVLDRPLDGVPILPVRLHDSVRPGDEVVPIGFGGGIQNQIGARRTRRPSAVLAVGPTANHDTGAVLGPREFEVSVATCRGDSGGPALDVRTGEVVGVVSRGGSCSAEGNHVYTRVDAYAGLAQVAFHAADRSSRQGVASNHVRLERIRLWR